MKIKTKLTYISLLVAVSILILSTTIIYFIVKQSMLQEIYNHFFSIISLQEERVNHEIDHNLERVALIASRTKLRLSLASYNDSQKPKDKQMMHHILSDALKSVGDFKEIFIINLEGKVVVATNKLKENKNYQAEAFFRKGKEAYNFEGLFSDKTGAPFFYLSGPLLLEDKLLGVVVVISKADSITNITSDYSGMGETGEVYLVNQDYYMVTPSRFIKNIVLKQKVDTINVRECFLHGTLSPEERKEKDEMKIFRDYRGIEVLGVHAYIAKTNWALLAEIDKKEVFGRMDNLRNVLIVLGIILILFMWIIAARVAETLSRPIQKLQHGVEIIGSGNLDYKVGTAKKDEIGSLSRAFNRMTENLKETTASRDELNEEIQERKKVEEILKQSERKFRDLVETTPDWVWEVDEKGVYTYVSPKVKELLGYEVAEILGKTPFDFMLDTEVEKVGNIFKEIIDKKEPFYGLENINRHKEGYSLTLETSGIPILNKEGEFKGYRGIDRDISQRKNFEEELVRVNKTLDENNQKLKDLLKLKDQFVAIASHDLKSPLISIMTSSKMLLAEEEVMKGLDADSKKLLNIIAERAQNVLDYVTELLALAYLGSGKLKIKISNIKLADLVTESIGIFSSRAKQKSIQLTANIADDLFIEVDKIFFGQAMNNLIGNALKFTPKKGKITVSASKDQEKIIIKVADNGVGMKPEDQEKLFTEFKKYYSLGTEGEKGTGLGLAICKKIIDAHGFEIDCNSEEGKGTEFIIKI
ncbi:ATP-binding protein [Candidatus Auribacterota bacterium]